MQTIVELPWEDVSHDVRKLNSRLYEVIENNPKIKPSKLKIFSYHFGETVGDHHFFYGPSGSDIKSKSIPFTMILSKYFEMHIQLSSDELPWKIYKPGDLFPYTRFLTVNKYFEPANTLSMSAGVRSGFFLINKISEMKRHKMLCKMYQIDTPPPKSLTEHHDMFKSLSKTQSKPWAGRLLIFPENFVDKATECSDFMEMIYEVSSKDQIFRKNIKAYEHILNMLLSQTKLTSSSIVRDSIKHLLYIGCGDNPAYFPTTSENYGPIDFLTKAYIEGFKSDSCPIFMAPDFLKPFESNNKAYYSLAKPDYLFKRDNIASQAALTKNIFEGFEYIMEQLNASGCATDTVFSMCSTNLTINSFYNLKSSPQTMNILNCDDISIRSICDSYALPFPENSVFLNNCFSIGYKDKFKI